MYFDLNIPIDPQPNRATADRLKLILSRFSQNEKSLIALNHTVDSCSPTKLTPIALIPFDIVKHPVEQISRVTVETDNELDAESIAALRANYDIVAIRTSSAAVFHAACTQYDIDLISLDCTQRLAFRIQAPVVREAINRSIYFELCYALGIRDNKSRTNLLQISHQLVQHTKGENLIISSEAASVSEIRAPFDILYFAKSLGLPNDKAQFVVKKYPQTLVAKAQDKKRERMIQ